MAKDVSQSMVEELAKEFVGKVGAGSLTREQAAYALAGIDGLRASTGRELNSQGLKLLDHFFRNPDRPPTVASIESALGRTRIPKDQLDNAMKFMADTDAVDGSIVRRALKNSDLAEGATGRVLKAVGRMTDDATRAGGKLLGKRGIGLLGALGGVAGKAFGGPALDVVLGTDAGAPGGLSDGEIPDEMLANAMMPSNYVQEPQMHPSRMTSNQVERIEERGDRRYERRESRARTKLDRNPDGVLQEVQRREEQVIMDASSPTSGNNNILRSLSDLMGK